MKNLFIVYLAALLLAVTACGKHSVDPAFTTYVESFTEAAKAQGKDVNVDESINFGAVSGQDTAGNCDKGFLKSASIIIDKSTWDQASDSTKTMLIWHELGHCVLNRDHKNDTEIDAVSGIKLPASIMNAKLPLDQYFTSRKDEYTKELFQ